MSRLTRPAATLVMACGMLIGSPAFAQETTSDVHGKLFIDVNANGVLDDGEPGLPAIELEFANGESIHTVATGQDGSFIAALTPGLWRVRIAALADLGLSNALSVDLTVPDEPAADLLLDLPLGPGLLDGLPVGFAGLGTLLGYADEIAAALDLEPDLSAEGTPAILETEPDSSGETDVYTGEYPTEDELLLLLPESGSTVHPSMRIAVGAIGIASIGLMLMALGWKARQA